MNKIIPVVPVVVAWFPKGFAWVLVLKKLVPPVDRPAPKLNGCAVEVVERPNVPAGFGPNRELPAKNT